MNALELQGLTKHYKGFTLGPLDLTLPGGTICGLIGENGAGKSTTIRLILDMVQRDGGTVTILGRDSRTASVRAKEEIGVVLGSEERMDALRGGQRASWGACMDPFAAWLLIRSLRTLEVRMARHSASADKVARFLQEHPRVRSVCYPGLETDEGHTLAQTQMTGYSGLMSFVPDADNEAIHVMVKSLDVFEEGPSWGGFESVVNTPGLNPNREMLQFEGIPQGLVRISVGLEDADTLIEDLDRALNTLPR